jgi:hypothetical protein
VKESEKARKNPTQAGHGLAGAARTATHAHSSQGCLALGLVLRRQLNRADYSESLLGVGQGPPSGTLAGGGTLAQFLEQDPVAVASFVHHCYRLSSAGDNTRSSEAEAPAGRALTDPKKRLTVIGPV